MPIYEYRCNACGFQKEHLQKVNSTPLSTCPSCGTDSYVKLLSAAGFQLKGSGWYATDFKNGSPNKPAAASESAPVAAPDTPKASCGGSCACHPA